MQPDPQYESVDPHQPHVEQQGPWGDPTQVYTPEHSPSSETVSPPEEPVLVAVEVEALETTDGVEDSTGLEETAEDSTGLDEADEVAKTPDADELVGTEIPGME